MGSAVDGLRISIEPTIYFTKRPSPTQFDIVFHNITDKDLVIDTGRATGETLCPKALYLILTDSRGASQVLEFADCPPQAPGQEAFFLFKPVSAHKSHTLQVDLAEYWDAKSLKRPDLKPGTYFLQAQFTDEKLPPDPRSYPAFIGTYWVGTLKSNQLKFGIPAP